MIIDSCRYSFDPFTMARKIGRASCHSERPFTMARRSSDLSCHSEWYLKVELNGLLMQFCEKPPFPHLLLDILICKILFCLVPQNMDQMNIRNDL